MPLDSIHLHTHLFKVMDGQPYFRLRIVDATQITPGHSKAGVSLNGLHVAGLQGENRERVMQGATGGEAEYAQECSRVSLETLHRPTTDGYHIAIVTHTTT